jgi:hypothetical protein
MKRGKQLVRTRKAIITSDIFVIREIYANTVEDTLQILVNLQRNVLLVYT